MLGSGPSVGGCDHGSVGVDCSGWWAYHNKTPTLLTILAINYIFQSLCQLTITLTDLTLFRSGWDFPGEGWKNLPRKP